MKNLLQTFFYSKQVSNLDVDGIDLTKKHFSILKKKKLLRSAYETFYREMSKNCDKHFNVDGLNLRFSLVDLTIIKTEDGSPEYSWIYMIMGFKLLLNFFANL